ncbi:hypothetical protein BGW39_002004 [Mortierella sp. 14UC]|nr:hypothetical protein BGW39_002004 [Mortierella sp. 14UC]
MPAPQEATFARDIITDQDEGPDSPSVSRGASLLHSGATAGAATNDHNNINDSNQRPIRCLQWNIERNYKADEILATLAELDADILCIQEIDIGCHRSGHDRDHFLEICKSQGLYGGFVPEFWELEHPGRKDRDQGGGVHGNAILSRWPVNGFRVLDHVHHAYEWERDGHKLNEPRLGRRFTIVADIQTPSGPLLCYCAHLEVFTGIVGRISALSDILADSELYSDRYPYQILFGDLNTISHSIARLAKTISTDQYRIGSFGSQESEWWDRNLWSWHVQDGEFNLALATGGWSWLRQLGFLGLGLGAGSSPNGAPQASPFWSADAKYSGWLARLVEAGLSMVKLARQEQLLTDKFITVEQESPLQQQQQQHEQDHKNNEQQQRSRGSDESHADELESEKSFYEEGSVILVGRPRSPSIITLESSLVDRNECMSSPSWSYPSTPSVLYAGQERDETDGENVEDDETGGVSVRSGRPNPPRVNVRHFRVSSTPSTPSPTLRLIPPTPKQSRSSGLDRVLISIDDEQRGIPLPFDDEEEYDNQQQLQDHDIQLDSILSQEGHQHQETIHHQHTTHDFQYPNDPNAPFTTFTTTEMTTTTTTMTSTSHHDIYYQQQQQYQKTEIIDTFKDPQPPFLLTTLQQNHSFFTTQRLWSGFTPLVLHQARNPGFYDPWCARRDMTLHNPNFFGILKAKLDYTLLKNLRCVGRAMGNHDYSASDHKWLLVEVEFERKFETAAQNEDDDEEQEQDVIQLEGLTEEEPSLSSQDRQDKEPVLPSKEQQYLWWRERRLEWGQNVQPLSHGHPKRLAEKERKKGRGQAHRNRKAGESSSSSPLGTTPLLAATFTAAVAVGGYWLWSRYK